MEQTTPHRGLIRLRLGFLVLVRHLGVALEVVEQRHRERVAAVQLVAVRLVPRRDRLLQRRRKLMSASSRLLPDRLALSAPALNLQW